MEAASTVVAVVFMVGAVFMVAAVSVAVAFMVGCPVPTSVRRSDLASIQASDRLFDPVLILPSGRFSGLVLGSITVSGFTDPQL